MDAVNSIYRLEEDMTEWAAWHKRKNALIERGIGRGMSAMRIASMMQISTSDVYRRINELKGKHADPDRASEKTIPASHGRTGGNSDRNHSQ
jgi:hypothetical protein